MPPEIRLLLESAGYSLCSDSDAVKTESGYIHLIYQEEGGEQVTRGFLTVDMGRLGIIPLPGHERLKEFV